MDFTPSDPPTPDYNNENRKRNLPDESSINDESFIINKSENIFSRFDSIGFSQISRQDSTNFHYEPSIYNCSMSQDCTDQMNRLNVYDSFSQPTQYNINNILNLEDDVITNKNSNITTSSTTSSNINNKNSIFPNGFSITKKSRLDSPQKPSSNNNLDIYQEKIITIDKIKKNLFFPSNLLQSNHPFYSLLPHLPINPSLPSDFYTNLNANSIANTYNPTIRTKEFKYYIEPYSPIPYLLENFEDLNIFLGKGISSDVSLWRHRITGINYAIKRKNFINNNTKTITQITHEACALAYLDHCLNTSSYIQFLYNSSKQNKNNNSIEFNEDNDEDNDEINEESNLMPLLPSFVRYYNSWNMPTGIIIQMELCDLGNLEDFISVNPSKFSIIRKNSIHDCLPNDEIWKVKKERLKNFIKNNENQIINSNENSNSSNSNSNFVLHSNLNETNTTNKNKNKFTSLLDSQDSFQLFDRQNSLQSINNDNSYIFPNTTKCNQNNFDESNFNFTNTQYEDKFTENIYEHINETDRSISEKLAWFILHALCSSLSFLHFKNMAHLDIRPGNIFLQTSLNSSFPIEFKSSVDSSFSSFKDSSNSINTKETTSFSLFDHVKNNNSFLDRTMSTTSSIGGNNSSILLQNYQNHRQNIEEAILNQKILLKIGDLSNSCPLDTENLREYGHIEEGATNYLSPELISEVDLEVVDFTKVDVYALGVTLYELCLGRLLTPNDVEEKIRKLNFDLEIEKKYSKRFLHLIKKCLSVQPQNRPSMIEIRDYTRRFIRLN